ncbi:VOC family protein [Flammeovirgaceae bacterium SG7u.111]|nr:VOC family protein [Flammeovirgaceae bacterium SG7u.132]WPO35634.1 VOC family protein [Flammeovirgaceae bacterium SG7u.111]
MSKHHLIDYLEIPVTDIAASKTFYGSLFNWKFTDYGSEYTSFADGKTEGGFAKVETAKLGGALIIFYSENLKRSKKEVEDAGGKITQDIFSFPGGKRFHFTDPTGNELAIWATE